MNKSKGKTKTKSKTASKSKRTRSNPLSINSVDPLVKKEFASFAHSKDITQSNLFNQIWNNFKNFHIKLSEEEQDIINKASSVASVTLKKRIRRYLLKTANQLIDQELNNQQEVNTLLKNSSKAADIRLAEIISEIMQANDNATHWYDRKYLSQKSIFDYARERKELNPDGYGVSIPVINRYLERYKALIASHHEKHGMNADHNSLAYHERERMKKTSINEAE